MIRVHRGLTIAAPKLVYQAQRLEHLAVDLRRMAEGTSPSMDQLASAPMMENWRFGSISIATLEGTAQGHPRLSSGPATSTEVWAIDLKRGWARTLSRLYRLGRCADGSDACD